MIQVRKMIIKPATHLSLFNLALNHLSQPTMSTNFCSLIIPKTVCSLVEACTKVYANFFDSMISSS